MPGKVFVKQTSLVVVTALVALNTSAGEKEQVKALLSDSLRIYNKLEEIKTQKKEATEKLDERLNTLRLKIKLLKGPVFDEERIRHYKDDIALAENVIAKHKAAIEFDKLTDSNERAKLAEKYEKERRRILAEELRAAKPFNKRINTIKKEVEDKQKIFEEVMKEYIRWPKEDYPAIVRTEIRAKYHAGSVTYEWWDTEHKHQAFCLAWIKLKEGPPPEDDAEMLDDKFHVVKLWPQSIEVQAGYCSVSFNIRDPEQWGKDKMGRYIRDFVDLDGLARIDPADGNGRLDELARGSLACSKRYRKIIYEKDDVVKPLTAERVKVKGLKAILQKPPADSEQLRKHREQIDFWAKERQDYRIRLEIGTLENPAERAALLKKLQADKDEIEVEKRSIEKPYNDKMRAMSRGLRKKDPLLNDAMKVYFLRPADGYEGLSEMSTSAMFLKAKITCSWKDKNGDTACSAIFFLRNQPSIPDNAKMLDNRYYLDMGGGMKDYIWLWIGNIHVYFNVKKKEWRGTEEIDQIVKKFVDLSGLGKISVF